MRAHKLPGVVNAFVSIFGSRYGYQYSPIVVDRRRYMTRHILYLGPICLRLHHFYQGDDARAPHDHPFWFITFPFTSYLEKVPHATPLRLRVMVSEKVQAWRPHFRRATYQHIVEGRADYSHKPFWTLVIAGSPSRVWGFWPTPFNFVKWWEWK